MIKMTLEVIQPALDLFGAERQKRGGGFNFRLKIREGILSIKPSSRPDPVINEMFGSLDRATGKSSFNADQEIPEGKYSFHRQ